MKITYGLNDNNIDVTKICLTKLLYNNIIIIPSGDLNRSEHFTDPLINIHKKIFIEINGKITKYEEFCTIKIDTRNYTITTINNDNIAEIHSTLKIKYGFFTEEFPEQKMAISYLNGTEKILEIGGNIGRNSLIIAHILKQNNTNLVTLESDHDIANQLLENRNLNNFNFFIENSALSKRQLIQQGWNTIVSDILIDGYKFVNIITFDELQTKYNIVFDTLVLDCEGAFYYILMDMPEILNNINLIIMENDYHAISHKNYIDEILTKNNFVVDYTEAGGFGLCYNNFFEVWIKKV